MDIQDQHTLEAAVKAIRYMAWDIKEISKSIKSLDDTLKLLVAAIKDSQLEKKEVPFENKTFSEQNIPF
jgi:hypothetical protein